MLVGYARVSTDDQNLNLQMDALDQAGCEQIFEDQLSGSKKQNDQGYTRLCNTPGPVTPSWFGDWID